MRRVLVLALVSLATLTASAGVASGNGSRKPKITPSTPVTPGSQYLSLGDSVTFGYMEPAVKPTPNYKNPKSFVAYPEQLAAQLRLKVTNAACPGETTASFMNTSAPSLGCEDIYRKRFPLHVSYKGSQLSFALSFLRSHRQVKLVSLMIGANDVFLCEETTRDHCLSKAERAAVFKKITTNVRKIVGAIRNKAGYKGQFVILNYYSLDYASSFITKGSIELNAALDAGAKSFNVRTANGFGTFKTAARHSGNNSCTAGLLTQVGNGKCGVHPSYAGQALLAQAVMKAIKLL